MTQKFGLSVALATPFDSNGDIAIEAMIEQARRSLAAGCSSVTLFGTTGEGSSIGTQNVSMFSLPLLDSGISRKADHRRRAGRRCRRRRRCQARHALARAPATSSSLRRPTSRMSAMTASSRLVFGRVRASWPPSPATSSSTTSPRSPWCRCRSSSSAACAPLFPTSSPGSRIPPATGPTPSAAGGHGDLVILIGDERHLARAVRIGGQGAISGMANFATCGSPRHGRRRARRCPRREFRARTAEISGHTGRESHGGRN